MSVRILKGIFWFLFSQKKSKHEDDFMFVFCWGAFQTIMFPRVWRKQSLAEDLCSTTVISHLLYYVVKHFIIYHLHQREKKRKKATSVFWILDSWLYSDFHHIWITCSAPNLYWNDQKYKMYRCWINTILLKCKCVFYLSVFNTFLSHLNVANTKTYFWHLSNHWRQLVLKLRPQHCERESQRFRSDLGPQSVFVDPRHWLSDWLSTMLIWTSQNFDVGMVLIRL